MSTNNSQRTLDNHLTLHAWLNDHFGYKTTRDLLNNTTRFDAEHNPSGDAALPSGRNAHR